MDKSLPNDLKIILSYAKEEAIRLGSYSISADHLFLGMLRYKNCDATKMLADTGIDLAAVKLAIEERIGTQEVIPYEKSGEVTISNQVKGIYSTAYSKLTPAGIQPNTAHILISLLTFDSSAARDVLLQAGANIEALIARVAQMQAGRQESVASAAGRAANASALETYGFDLTRAALAGKLDPVVGREVEIERLAQILCRRKKNNPVLIGGPGVGKSAIVEGLALLIAAKRVSRQLLDKRVITLDLGSIVAGTKYRGQFEERIKSIIQEIKKNPDIIIFIDEMHTLVGAGGAPGSLDAANLLKPALARGEIQCIGATTLDEYREIVEKDGALERRFQKIVVEPTDFAQTLAIMEGIRGRYEEFHHVTYTDAAIRACITLSQRYISDRCLPDKAIDVLDEAGSRAHLSVGELPEEVVRMEGDLEPVRVKKREAALRGDFREAARLRAEEKEKLVALKNRADALLTTGEIDTVTVNEDDVAKAVSVITGIPVHKIARDESLRLMNMEKALQSTIIGQDEAISRVVKAIRRNRAGIKDPGKPIGTFLFLGPTGVGKTHLAKKIAEYMFDSPDNIIRIDMSEYGEKFAVSRMIGAPPGYVGYQEGGQLSEQVRRKPYSVVLLDEVEKAHPDIFNVLLQVLDEGRLTDGSGRTVDFKNTILILTSNIGSRELKDFGGGMGFTTSAADTSRSRKNIIDKAISKAFSPEFINRLDEQVYFNSLSQDDICKIIDIELGTLSRRLEEMGYALTIDKAAKRFIAEVGYDPKFGARPLKRAIQRYVEDPVSEAIIEGTGYAPEGVAGCAPMRTMRIALNAAKNGTIVKRPRS